MEKYARQWRDPLEIVSLTQNIADIDPKLLKYKIEGSWWQILEELGITLFVTREYEHLVLAYSVVTGKPRISYFFLPHPSGMVYDLSKKILFIASSRNPNQLFSFQPVNIFSTRLDFDPGMLESFSEIKPMLPVSSVFLPGCTYLHDLAIIDSTLHANAVGQNAVIRFDDLGHPKRVWWPECVEVDGMPEFRQNYLQLNSIAAGSNLKSSFFSASTEHLSFRRPGHKNFKVDKQGVIFSGETRRPIVRGLTRPHSARIHQGKVWVDNSGYGEVGWIESEIYHIHARLPGWTRGLKIIGSKIFVGTSRVIPRFRQYAPGLDVDKSVCGVHILDLDTGSVIGKIVFPFGNQIFSFAALPSDFTAGFSSQVGKKRSVSKETYLYYSFSKEKV